MDSTTVAIIVAIVGVAGVAIGGVLTGGIQYWLNQQQFKQQIEREYRLHRRELAARRHEEMKAKYVRLLLASRKVNFLVWDLWVAHPSAQNPRLQDTPEFDEYGVAAALVSIEAGHDEIVDLENKYGSLLQT